jgi:Cellulase (glycosyl hydrolase family 5)
MRLATALALTAATAAALAAPAQAAPYRGAQMIPLRVDTPADGIAKELDIAKKAKLNLVKADVSWAQLEPADGAYSEDYLDRIDELTAAAARRKLKVLLLLQTTPCWTNSGPEGSCTDAGSDYPPIDYDAYGRAAALLAERFGSRLAAIEVWNEPDHVNEEYWKGDDKAGRYAELVKATYPKVKAADGRVQVLAGALVGASGDFLQELYDAGIKGSYDGISVHYYDLVLASLRSIREKQRANGDSKPVWLTEFGFTSCYPAETEEEGHPCVSRRDQGTFLLDIFQALRKTSWVRGAVIYNMRDTEQYKFGLASPTFEPKPSLTKLAKAFSRKLAAPRKIKLRESGSGVTGTAPVGDVMKLQAYKGSCKRQRQGAQPKYEVFDQRLVRGRFNWELPALTRGKWCIYAEHYWTKRTALVDIT